MESLVLQSGLPVTEEAWGGLVCVCGHCTPVGAKAPTGHGWVFLGGGGDGRHRVLLL